ncbi:MAG: hypothetical protein H0X67_15345 [Acidobacteria bacterium]|nr:hypothetical protein [Acidobacteriota bacterium]
MLTAYQTVLTLHIAAGLIGLAAFWTPAVARKGGTVHVRAGRIFFYCTCLIAASGLAMGALILADPLAVKPPTRALTPEGAAAHAAAYRAYVPFLVYLVLITFTPVYHGVRVLQTRQAPHQLRTPFHTAINVVAIAMSFVLLGFGIWMRQPVFMALSPIGVLAGWGHLQFARRPYPSRMAWWYEHMGSMMGGGVAFHTAFMVLGAGRLLGISTDGTWAVLPWLMPTIIGIPAGTIWVRYYRRKFREDDARPVPSHA